jgi:sirohydrochlorin cobaltochelatase
MRGIVLFAHGAKDPQWAEPFAALRERVRTARPEYPIEIAYLEIMSPTLEEAIAPSSPRALRRDGVSRSSWPRAGT